MHIFANTPFTKSERQNLEVICRLTKYVKVLSLNVGSPDVTTVQQERNHETNGNTLRKYKKYTVCRRFTTSPQVGLFYGHYFYKYICNRIENEFQIKITSLTSQASRFTFTSPSFWTNTHTSIHYVWLTNRLKGVPLCRAPHALCRFPILGVGWRNEHKRGCHLGCGTLFMPSACEYRIHFTCFC